MSDCERAIIEQYLKAREDFQMDKAYRLRKKMKQMIEEDEDPCKEMAYERQSAQG